MDNGIEILPAHAKRFSASSADRWVRCPGSISLSEGVLRTSSKYADEGTKVHSIAAEILSGKLIPNDLTKEDNIFLKKYIDYVQEITKHVDITNVHIEKIVKYRNLAPINFDTTNDFFGTADAIVYEPNKEILHVIDLKWGIGVKVDIEDNYQLICYAIGASNKYFNVNNIKTIRIHIVQPRIYNIVSIDITLEQLVMYEKLFKEAVLVSLSKNAPLNPHVKACKFCPAKYKCPALMKLTKNITTTTNFINKNELNEDDYKFILDNSSLITDFIKSVEEKMYNKAMQGEVIKDYKLVDGKNTRKWTNNAAKLLEEKLGDKAYDKKLIGVTAADKLVNKELMEEITYKELSKPLLVKSNDKRKELIIEATNHNFKG